MNVYINARFLTQPITGVQRYALETLKALDKLIGGLSTINCSFTMLAPQNIKYELKLDYIPLKCVGRLGGHLWDQIELPYYSRDGILLSLCNTAPLIRRKQIVAIHDAGCYAFPEGYSFAFRNWYKFMIASLGFISRKIITVSDFSKKELIQYCHMKEDKIAVVYEGKEHILSVEPDQSILQNAKLQSKPYVLAVSSHSPRKNFNSVVEAIALFDKELDFNFAIAGGTDVRVLGRDHKKLPATVIQLGYVTDSQLRALYENAMCFIYPSFYEGFGIPPLEAMACGCPVIASNVTSIPEVCGKAALYCNPHDPYDIAEKIALIARNQQLREEFRQKGYQKAREYSWDKCAENILNLVMETQKMG